MNESLIPILDLRSQYESIKGPLHEAIERVLSSGNFIMGPDVHAFETEVASYLGVKHAIAVNSGTDALVIALRCLGIGAGDEVITTPFTFFATGESISNVGATPLFADVDEETFTISPAAIAARITPRTKAIVPVHLYGQAAAMDEIMALAKRHGLKVIEDCAQSFGAQYKGHMTGSMGDAGSYSFFPSKNLGAYGDGGLLVTAQDDIAETARMLRVHGARKRYHNEMLGYNSRLDSLQAAILRVKLPHIERWNQRRRETAMHYNRFLEGTPHLILPPVTAGHVFHQYTVRITNGRRDAVADHLREQNISTMIYYPVPQDRLPIYKSLKAPANPVSDLLTEQILSLPIWPEIQQSTVERVALVLRQALSR